MDKIRTGLYSDKAFNLLIHILASQLDELPYCHTMTSVIKTIDIDREPDNEIVFTRHSNVIPWRYRTSKFFWEKSNDEALKWYANSIKKLVDQISSSSYRHIDWKWTNVFDELVLNINTTNICVRERKSLITSDLLPWSVSIRDMHFIYDKFKSRDNLIAKYDKKLVDSYVGRPNDPVSTEIEIVRRQELEKLKAKHIEDYKNITSDETAERESLCQELQSKIEKIKKEYEDRFEAVSAKFDLLRKSLNVEYLEAIDKVNKTYTPIC